MTTVLGAKSGAVVHSVHQNAPRRKSLCSKDLRQFIALLGGLRKSLCSKDLRKVVQFAVQFFLPIQLVNQLFVERVIL